MRPLLSVTTALFLAIVSTESHSAEVKGLKLGQIYSHESLANLFGNADCPSQSDISRQPAHLDAFTCKVPISYLGLSTSAEVSLSRNWQARSIWIALPKERLDEIEQLLIEKNGEPTLRIGTFERMVPGLNGGAEQPLHARCATWPNADGASVRLCKERLLPFGKSGPYIIYSISTETELDPNDI